MFEPVRQEGTLTQVLGLMVGIYRSRSVRRFVLFLMTLLIAGLGGWSWFWQAALSEECREVGVRAFTVEEIKGIRQRKAQYQMSEELSPWLSLSAEEVTFFISEFSDVSLQMQAMGDQVEAQLGYPWGEGCYNIDYSGTAEIENGVLVLNPSTLVIGGYNLSWLVGMRTFTYTSGDVADPLLRRRLGNMRAMRVTDGRFQFRIKNRRID